MRIWELLFVNFKFFSYLTIQINMDGACLTNPRFISPTRSAAIIILLLLIKDYKSNFLYAIKQVYLFQIFDIVSF